VDLLRLKEWNYLLDEPNEVFNQGFVSTSHLTLCTQPHSPPPPFPLAVSFQLSLRFFHSPSSPSSLLLRQMQHMRSLNGGFSAANSSTTSFSSNASYMSNNQSASVPFFPSGLTGLAMIVHLCTHPKIKDWLQLLILGIAATFARKASKEAKSWLQRVFCVTSVHLNERRVL
jgi:hypothetical protein